MIDSDYRAWDECPSVDNCELIHSFLELVDSMVRDIQHLKAETIRARYELSQKFSLRISQAHLLTILVFPTAAPTTNIAAIITIELFSIPPHASLNPQTPVISKAMGIIMAATWIFTFPDKINAIKRRKITRTIKI